MTAITNLKTAIENKITTTAKQKVFSLTQNAFPGPIQSIIGDYLNGITIPLGSAGSLTVDPNTKQLELNSNIDSADLALDGSADKATLTLSSTKSSLKGASIKLTFNKIDAGVSLEMDISMGDSLQWELDSVWPQYLDWAPANKLGLSKGELDLTVASGDKIDFTGTGSMVYDDQVLANGAIRVEHNDSTTGILVGVVVVSWSPGDFWKPLNVLTFNHSGLVFATLDIDSNSLVSLCLLEASQVPALNGDFTIKPGMAFFTSLQLTGKLNSVATFMGNVTEIDLFAFYAKTSGDLSIKASLLDSFGAGGKEVFQFNGFTLDWENPETALGSITASAVGHFNPDPSTSIELDLSGTVDPSGGDFSLNFTLKNWPHPFEIPTVTIEEATAGVTIGAQSEGVTIDFGGEIKLQNPSNPNEEFELSFIFEIADFEVPTGIALLMDADYEELDLTSALGAAFAVDLSPQTLKKKGDTALAEIVTLIDDLIKIKNFDFWFVEGATLTLSGQSYPPGFGLKSDFDFFNQEEVDVSVILSEKPSLTTGYSGSILLEEAIQFGKVLDIAGWDPDKNQKTNSGPEFAIAATPDGKVIEGINNGKPVYFYTSAYLTFVDLLDAHIYGIATPDGIFQFEEAVQAGTKVGSSGAWAGESIIIGLNPKQFEFNASFSFNFGWKNIQWPALKLWGVTLVPSGSLPSFNVMAALSVYASLQLFTVKGAFDFDFLGAHLDWGGPGDEKTLLTLSLKDAVTSISELAEKLLDKLKDIISDLLEAALDSVLKFINWVKNKLNQFVDGLKAVALILKNEFKLVEKDLVNALKEVGALAAEVQKVLIDDLEYAASKVEGWLKEVYGCAIEQASNLL